ncbi:MAG TPA: arginase family protein [Gaiellaceae bacterium]|jgi:arginase family enzyme|nr:arginase family protein [Gaiellaceae bacterium]
MSRLRAKCPDCLAYTAVALNGDYECHACGRTFAAGLVRVPRAWGDGGEGMVEAASLRLDFPETAVIAEDSLEEQNLAVALDLPERPVVLGGCCCSHIGAVEALAARHGPVGLLWFDAHGDLNTPATSPSGNEWGMPLRMLLDSGAVRQEDVALIGARNLDPAEEDFIASVGLGVGPETVDGALADTAGMYVALDFDAFAEDEVASWMPEPGGLAVTDAEALLRSAREQKPVLGVGLSGLLRREENLQPVARLTAALGL